MSTATSQLLLAFLIAVGAMQSMPRKCPEYGFSMRIPRGWTEKPTLSEGGILKLTAGEGPDKSILLVSATSVASGSVISDSVKQAVLSALSDPEADPMRPFKSGFTITSVERDSVDGMPAIRAELSYVYDLPSGENIPIQEIDYYVVHHGRLITFGAELVANENHRRDFADAVGSVRFDDGAESGGLATPSSSRGQPAERRSVAAIDAWGLRILLFCAAGLATGSLVAWRRASKKRARARQANGP